MSNIQSPRFGNLYGISPRIMNCLLPRPTIKSFLDNQLEADGAKSLLLDPTKIQTGLPADCSAYYLTQDEFQRANTIAPDFVKDPYNSTPTDDQAQELSEMIADLRQKHQITFIDLNL